MDPEYILVPRAVTPPTEASPEHKGHIFSLLCSSLGFTVRKQSKLSSLLSLPSSLLYLVYFSLAFITT